MDDEAGGRSGPPKPAAAADPLKVSRADPTLFLMLKKIYVFVYCIFFFMMKMPVDFLPRLYTYIYIYKYYGSD